MHERTTLDAFEQRIAAELERFVAPAGDPKTAAEIAAVAMRPRGMGVRYRNVTRPRRFLLLGLAAALLVPAAYVGVRVIRPPVSDVVNQVQLPGDGPQRTTPPGETGTVDPVSIFVRRDDGPVSGLSIYAVRPDGGEVLVRRIADSLVTTRGTLSPWGSVSRSGWLALSLDVFGGAWPLILVDLADPNGAPWVIDQAGLGATGPRWGPTGLVAAPGTSDSLVIADPATRTIRQVSMQGYDLFGGGPTIIWSADGRGIVGSSGGRSDVVIPIDGSPAVPGVTRIFDPGYYGPGLAELRVCSMDASSCQGGEVSHVQRVERDGSFANVIVTGAGGEDRVLGARFGAGPSEYWLTTSRDRGRQLGIVHVQDGRGDVVATVDRAAAWQYVGAPDPAPDGSVIVSGTADGDVPFAVLVPPHGGLPTSHAGSFAGTVDGATAARLVAGRPVVPGEPVPTVGEPFALKSVDELIATELATNPGRAVVAKGSREGVDGDTAVRTFEVTRDRRGGGETHVDCSGPASLTVTSGSRMITDPCLQAGSSSFLIDSNDPIVVTASGDTSWRVVVYWP